MSQLTGLGLSLDISVKCMKLVISVTNRKTLVTVRELFSKMGPKIGCHRMGRNQRMVRVFTGQI